MSLRASESVGVRVGQKVEVGPHMTCQEGWDDSLLVTPLGWFLSTDTQRSTVTMYCANRVVTKVLPYVAIGLRSNICTKKNDPVENS